MLVPEINSFYPNSGIKGTNVSIIGNNFIPQVPTEEGPGPYVNTSIVKFNGVIAKAGQIYQDSINMQRINTIVPEGVTSGPITVTAMGTTSSSIEDFIVIEPNYLSNVTVSTASDYGGIDVDRDAEGNLYVANNDHKEIVKITPDGTKTIFWSGDVTSQQTLLGIAVDKHGNVFATIEDSIRKISPDGAFTILAGTTKGYLDASVNTAQFSDIRGIVVDSSCNIYICDSGNYVVRKISWDGTVVTLAGGLFGNPDGPG